MLVPLLLLLLMALLSGGLGFGVRVHCKLCCRFTRYPVSVFGPPSEGQVGHIG